jgi:hypothetical protein
MSGPMAQGPTPPYAAPAPAPAQPPPPMWAPAGGSYLPSMRHDPWGMISFASRAIGFLLLFIAAIVLVAAVSIPGSCYTTPTSCGATWLSNAATAALIAKILAVIGLAALGFGAAVKLHYGLKPTAATSADEGRIIASERRVEGALFITSLVLLVVIAITVNVFPTFTFPGL